MQRADNALVSVLSGTKPNRILRFTFLRKAGLSQEDETVELHEEVAERFAKQIRQTIAIPSATKRNIIHAEIRGS